jgi:hypothetical protein
MARNASNKSGALGAIRLLTAQQRLDEAAQILAVGLQRLLTRQSSRLSADFGESSLDIPPERSGHPEDSAGENPT